jgi:hypothetical protein
MTRLSGIIVLSVILGVVVFGCSRVEEPFEPGMRNPNASLMAPANGTESLGDIDLALEAGSGIVAKGVGLRNAQPDNIDLNVPGDVMQVLLYWEGQNATSGGDDMIRVAGIDVTGTLIGGPTLFFGSAYSSTYRADITGLGIVGSGMNSIPVEGMGFTTANNGAGIIVIYDDGSGAAEIMIKDGNDCAYYGFSPPLDTTVPQTFNFTASSSTRQATLVNFATSVAANRPNVVEITIDAVVTRIVDPFGDTDGPEWDTAVDVIDIPAGATSLTIQALSEKDPSSELTGDAASLTWCASALSVPPAEVPPAAVGDFVWDDMNNNGIQDPGEPGIEDVWVYLHECGNPNPIDSMQTDANGEYLFDGLTPGSYMIRFALPTDYQFSPQDQGMDDAVDSDPDPATGITVCIDLEAGETDLTWDAGMYMPPAGGEGCTHGYWKNHESVWPMTGYGLDDDFDTTFGVDLFDPDITLYDAVVQGGGGVKRLARHGVAALLSAAHPNVYFDLNEAEVIALVQAGDADMLEYYVELGCPLDKDGEREEEDDFDDFDQVGRNGLLSDE